MSGRPHLCTFAGEDCHPCWEMLVQVSELRNPLQCLTLGTGPNTNFGLTSSRFAEEVRSRAESSQDQAIFEASAFIPFGIHHNRRMEGRPQVVREVDGTTHAEEPNERTALLHGPLKNITRSATPVHEEDCDGLNWSSQLLALTRLTLPMWITNLLEYSITGTTVAVTLVQKSQCPMSACDTCSSRPRALKCAFHVLSLFSRLAGASLAVHQLWARKV